MLTGKNLRAWRKENVITQAEAAELFGVHKDTIRNWEREHNLSPMVENTLVMLKIYPLIGHALIRCDEANPDPKDYNYDAIMDTLNYLRRIRALVREHGTMSICPPLKPHRSAPARNATSSRQCGPSGAPIEEREEGP